MSVTLAAPGGFVGLRGVRKKPEEGAAPVEGQSNSLSACSVSLWVCDAGL